MHLRTFLLATVLLCGTVQAAQFDRIGAAADQTIDVDRSTISQLIDADGDTLSGAMFQVTSTGPTATGAVRYVAAVIAVCGFDALIALNTKIYNSDGEMVAERTEPVAQTGIKDGVPKVVYKFLCDGKPTQRWNNNA